MFKLQHLLCIGLLFYVTTISAQNRTITGKVTSSQDQSSIPGVTVSLRGSSQGVATSADGSFSITAPAGKVTLQLSSVGYGNKEIEVAPNDNSVTISLDVDSRQMGEVVVTALGIQRQAKSLTYATQRISGDKLNEAKEVNLVNALQGKVAGVTITKNASGPGSASKVLLRGNRSIQGNNQPLYVIDGVPLDNSSRDQPSSTFGGRDGGDGVGMINPDDVETMTILKGASAAALYGSAGQNGAIIITTKRGKSGKIAIDFNSGVMIETASVLPDLQYDYAQGDAGFYGKNSEHSWGPKITGSQKDTLWNGDIVTIQGQPNRLKDFFRTAHTLTNTISVTGGSDKIQTYFSYGNTAAQGIVPNHELQRHNVSLKINTQVTSKLSIESKLNYIFEKVNNKPFIGEAPNSVVSLYRTPVTIPLSEMQKFEYTDELGDLRQSYWKPQSSILENPYWILNRDLYYEKKDRIIGLISARYAFTDWLSLMVRGSIDKTLENAENKIYGDSYYSLVGSNYTTRDYNHYNTNLDALLSFKRDITSDITLSGNLGGSIQEGRGTDFNLNAGGLNKQNFFYFGNSKAPQSNNSQFRGPQVQSLYAAVTAGYKNYLFLDVTARNDWSSALPAPYSYFYPSIGLTGIISDMTSLPNWISYGKARVSFAGSGAGGVGYRDRRYYNVLNGGLIGTPTIQTFGDQKPELTSSWEAGLEWRFLNDRIGFDATFYNSETKNQLLLIGVPPASLYSNKYINSGLIRNSGIELVVNGTPVKTRDFGWDIQINFAKNNNKIVRLHPVIKEAVVADEPRDAAIKAVEGGSYGDLYVKVWRTDSATGHKLVDTLGKPLLSAGNDTFLGNFNPDFMMGINNTISYKNFSLSFLIDYRKGGYVISGTQALIDADGHSARSLEGRENGLVLDAYTEDGKKNTKSIPAQTFWSYMGDRYPVGGFYAYSATNIRLRELIVSYRLGSKLLAGTGFVKEAKISLVGRNLFFFKKDAPFDPEIAIGTGNGGGIEYGSLPATRGMGVNLKLSF
jgi:TonB-linked SusC/RagA family outer membrane protein